MIVLILGRNSSVVADALRSNPSLKGAHFIDLDAVQSEAENDEAAEHLASHFRQAVVVWARSDYFCVPKIKTDADIAIVSDKATDTSVGIARNSLMGHEAFSLKMEDLKDFDFLQMDWSVFMKKPDYLR